MNTELKEKAKEKSYLHKFLNLKCAGTLLGTLYPISSGVEKEVSEAWAITRRIKDRIFNKERDYYNIVELCAGNPVTGILARLLFPVSSVTSVDKRLIERDYSQIRDYKYIQKNIYDKDIVDLINSKTIIISSHPCKNLAIRVAELFNITKAAGLYFIPCCHGSLPERWKQRQFLKENIGVYQTWCFYLAVLCNGHLEEDKHCLSPKNIVISAIRSEKDIFLKKLKDGFDFRDKLMSLGMPVSTDMLLGKSKEDFLKEIGIDMDMDKVIESMKEEKL